MLLSRCKYFDCKLRFIDNGSLDDISHVDLPIYDLTEGLSIIDTSALLYYCSIPKIDALVLSHYSINELLKFSDYFQCDYLLMEYFAFFISRDLLLTMREFFQVLCHYSIKHPIVQHALLCYATALNLDFDVLEDLLHNRSFMPVANFDPYRIYEKPIPNFDHKARYAFYRFRHKLRNALRSKQYYDRIVFGWCQVGNHQMVFLPATQYSKTFYLKWGATLACCGSICCRPCFDWIFSRRAMALPNSTTCPICYVYLDVNTREYLWEFSDFLEAREMSNQRELNGLRDPNSWERLKIPPPAQPEYQPNIPIPDHLYHEFYP